MTLLEMVVAMSIMVIVFVAVLPQLSLIQNNWDSREGIAETIQNGRVLADHLSRNLSKAIKITAVSNSTDTTGYIEFLDNDDNTLRYDIAVNNYIEFGQVGSQSDLAGPVSSLQFTCYDGNDFSSTTTDGNDIRFVKAEATVTNPASLGQDKTFTAWAYLRTNAGSLIGWWKLDETSGLLARDSSGRENHGTLYNMAGSEWTSGITDGALEFDGTEDYIAVSNSSSLQLTNALTLTAWIKGDAWGSGSSVNIVARKGEGNPNNYQLAVADGQVSLYLDDSDGNGFRGDTVLNTGQWYHVAATWDGSTVRVYLDGVLDNDPPDSYTSPLATDSRPLYIGGREGADWFDGIIDDVRIYNRALTAVEVAQLADTLRYQQFTEAKADSDVTSITISTPNTSESDLLIAAVATDGDTSASLAPPGGEGWTQLDVGAYGSEVTLGAWWKLAGASESASHQFTWTGSEQAYAWMMRFTSHDPADPIDVSATYGESSSTPTSPAVTTTVDNCIILRLGGFDDDDITEDSPGLSGHTAITMDQSATRQVTYQEFTEAKAGSNVTSITISTPSGTSAGDLLVAAVATDSSETISPPSGEGWTQIDLGYGGSAVTLGVWWKLADASESPTHQFTWGSTEQAYAWIMRFTDHDPTTPINASAVQNDNSSSPTSPAVTTTVANTLIVRIGGFDDDDITEDNPGLSGHTAITMDESNSGNSTCSGGAGYIQQSAAGDSGTSTFSLTSGEQYRTVTIAIAPDTTTDSGSVSGGAGYVRQSASGDSGTSTFSLTASEESRTVTIGIAPDASGSGEQIYP